MKIVHFKKFFWAVVFVILFFMLTPFWAIIVYAAGSGDPQTPLIILSIFLGIAGMLFSIMTYDKYTNIKQIKRTLYIVAWVAYWPFLILLAEIKNIIVTVIIASLYTIILIAIGWTWTIKNRSKKR